MEISGTVLLAILGSALVTFLPRVLPLAVLSRFDLPDWAMRWLRHVPIAVMSALVGQELFVPNGKLSFLGQGTEIAAAVLTFLVAVVTRSLIGTVVAGVIFAMVLRLWF